MTRVRNQNRYETESVSCDAPSRDRCGGHGEAVRGSSTERGTPAIDGTIQRNEEPPVAAEPAHEANEAEARNKGSRGWGTRCAGAYTPPIHLRSSQTALREVRLRLSKTFFAADSRLPFFRLLKASLALDPLAQKYLPKNFRKKHRQHTEQSPCTYLPSAEPKLY